jgi:UDP-N-acetylmuramate: L-alanyl-gamma-D-glutamyl-meso-diaminopimelate ligase
MLLNNDGRALRIHFSGIGGTAMVAGARLAIEAGWEVRGSDNPLYPPTSDMVAALERRLHYVSLAEWIKDAVLRQRRPVVIAGTHGKTTTTALTAWVLECAGMQPGYLIGGQPLDFPHSARLGPEGAPFVIEGDEYDTAFFDKRAKFLHYLPVIAVVTSVEFDHGDIYKDLDEIDRAFQYMLRQVPKSGWLIACADNPGSAKLAAHAFCQVATYGFAASADWRGECLGQHLRVYRHGTLWADIVTQLTGRYNFQNALAAVAVAATLGATPKSVTAALAQFRGVKRRMEIFLEARGMTFIDDFAHHPTAIRETVAAARQRWPERRLRVLFEPRSNTVVTRQFQGELTEAFTGADEVWIGPIYRAEKIPESERLDRATIVDALESKGIRARYTDNVEDIVEDVLQRGEDGDLILILSNGAFGGIYSIFATRIL